MHTCIHAYMHACIHAYMHACIHAYMHTCIHAYMHTCMHAYMHTCIHTCIHAYMHTRIHAYIAYTHTRIHAYMHTCIHAYMHTCIHTYIHVCIYYGCNDRHIYIYRERGSHPGVDRIWFRRFLSSVSEYLPPSQLSSRNSWIPYHLLHVVAVFRTWHFRFKRCCSVSSAFIMSFTPQLTNNLVATLQEDLWNFPLPHERWQDHPPCFGATKTAAATSPFDTFCQALCYWHLGGPAGCCPCSEQVCVQSN